MGGGNLQSLLQDEWIKGLTFKGFVNYSQKNVEEFKKGYEAVEIPDSVAQQIKGIKSEVRLLMLGADWCGDVVANLPAIARLADLSPNIELRILDRDRHEELMNHFLTNGGKAIPVLIVTNGDMSEHRRWGPRPAECQRIMDENKDKKPKEEIYPMIRDWYMNDKYQTCLREVLEAIRDVVPVPVD